MLKKLLIVIISALIVFAIYVNSRSGEFKVTRSIVISSNQENIFEHINNQMNWPKWSPWAKLDPEMKVFFGGEKEGIDSIYKWEGNDKVGAGSSTITDSKIDEYVKFKLEFLKPVKNTYFSEFYFSKVEGGVLVAWTMHGEKGFVEKLFGIFTDCEAMVGEDFEKGLEALKRVVEGGE